MVVGMFEAEQGDFGNGSGGSLQHSVACPLLVFVTQLLVRSPFFLWLNSFIEGLNSFYGSIHLFILLLLTQNYRTTFYIPCGASRLATALTKEITVDFDLIST